MDRHRYRGVGGKCADCQRVYSNPVHRQSKDALHQPMPRAISSITPEEMVDALLSVRLGCEGSDSDDQLKSTRYYAERLLTRLSEGPVEAEREEQAMSTDTRPAEGFQVIPQIVDPLAVYVGQVASRFAAPEDRLDAVDELWRLVKEARRTAPLVTPVLPSNPAPVVGALRRLVETWEAAAEDTIGENVLALGPLMVEGRAVLAALPAQREPARAADAARHATPELDVERLAESIPAIFVDLGTRQARNALANRIAAAYAQAGDAVEAEREERGR